MNQDQKDRALRDLFFKQSQRRGPISGWILDQSVFWSSERRFRWERLKRSKSHAQMRALGDLWFLNLCAQNP